MEWIENELEKGRGLELEETNQNQELRNHLRLEAGLFSSHQISLLSLTFTKQQLQRKQGFSFISSPHHHAQSCQQEGEAELIVFSGTRNE